MHGLLFLYFCQSCEVCKQLFGADFIKRDFEQRIVRHRRGGNDETRAERLVQDSIAYAVCTGVNPPASATDFAFGASPNGFAPPKFGIETGRAL